MRLRKKKLEIDSDNDIISPKVLSTALHPDFEQQPHPEQAPSVLPLNRKPTLKDTIHDYFISIVEPVHAETMPFPKPTTPNLDQHLAYHTNAAKRKKRQKTSLSSLSSFDPQKKDKIDRQMTKMHQITFGSEQKNNCRLLFEKNNELQLLIKRQKIQQLKRNFLKKVRRTSTHHPPAQYHLIQQQQAQGFLDKKGLEVPPMVTSLLNLLSAIQIITLLMVYSISLVFEDLLSGDYSLLQSLQISSFIFYFLEIILNLVTVKYSSGKRIEVIRDIIEHYRSRNLWIDCVSFIILLIDISTTAKFIPYLRIFIIFKLPQCLEKIENVEVYFVRNVYNQQYWELSKVFLVNFCYAHIIGLCLGAMANLVPHQSWVVSKGIQSAPWGQKYVWSVYWAVNIMLTVGFGDIAAANHKQALCLIFIETFSCIIMAYNINQVGSIINNIRQENQNRSKKLKIFKKLTDQNEVPEELNFKINNYIEQSSKIKKKFNYQEDQEFLKQLPSNLRTTYLRQANKQVLSQLVFFRGLLDRTLANFSEQLETKISHPQEVIRSLDDDFKLLILRKGHLGYVCRKNGCGLNDTITDQVRVSHKDLPFLTSLDFLSQVRPDYEIKSLQFSVLFTLSYSTFIEIFRKSDMDYYLFCFLRDKCRNIPDQFGVKACEFCQNLNHFKFTCPRLHYAPYQQHIIDRYLHQQKKGKNIRKQFDRQKQLVFTPLEYYRKIKEYQVKGNNQGLTQTSFRSVLQQTLAQHYSAVKMKASRQNNRPRTFTTIERNRDERLREVVEQQLLKRERALNFEDQIWNIQIDTMHNFNGYFSKDNPKRLTDRFSRQARIAQRKLRYKIRSEQPAFENQVDSIVEASHCQQWISNLQENSSTTSHQDSH